MDRLSISGSFGFALRGTDGQARLGRLTTPRGDADTPAFMPVGTQAAVKAITCDELRTTGTRIVLSNTYHLYLRPGHELVRELGGLHCFMGWGGPILTDSGGFQAFSLAKLRTIDEDGVRFRSHLDGSAHVLTPEKSMEIQSCLGSDIAMALDECPALPAPTEALIAAVDRTTRWARRCREAYHGPGVLFAIVQGGSDLELRERSARDLVALDFPGYAVGGVSVGEPSEAVLRVVRASADLLPPDRPRYLMGVGTPADLVHAVSSGFDLFDCVLPTRNARNGTLFTSQGKVNIKRAEFRADSRPLDDTCPCEACTRHPRAYLRHLFVCGEILAARLHTIHNVTYYQRLMGRMRDAIETGSFVSFRDSFLASPEAREAEA